MPSKGDNSSVNLDGIFHDKIAVRKKIQFLIVKEDGSYSRWPVLHGLSLAVYPIKERHFFHSNDKTIADEILFVS